MRVSLLALTLLLCALAATAQISTPLPDAPHVYALNVEHSALAPAPDPYSLARPLPPGLAPVLRVPVEPPRPKVLDRKFLALGIGVFALTSMDVEMTHHCLAAGTCYEMNPTLPDSRAGQYAINTATNTAVMYFSYRRRKAGKWGWWIPPVVDIAAHVVGVGSNIRFLH